MAGTVPLKAKEHPPFMNHKRKVTAATEAPTARKTPKVAVGPQVFPKIPPPYFQEVHRFPPLPKTKTPNTMPNITATAMEAKKAKAHTPFMDHKRKVTAATETPTERKTPKLAVGPQVFPKFPSTYFQQATAMEAKKAMKTMANRPWDYYRSSKRNSVPVPYKGPTAEKSGPRHLSGPVKRKTAPQYQHLEKDDDEFLDECGSESGSQLSASVNSKEASQYEDFEKSDDEILDDCEPEASHKSGSCGSSYDRRGSNGAFVSDNMEEGRKKKSVDFEYEIDNCACEIERQRIMHVGPKDKSIIPSFEGHVAKRLWEGEDRKVLKCHNQARACNTLQAWREELSDDVKACLDATKLGHLPWSMFSDIDFPLISAFVERWQPDTNTFHLPFGEMTIMLHDVVQILRIPVEGHMVSAQYSEESLKLCIRELFGELGLKNSLHLTEGGIPIDSFVKFFRHSDPPKYNDTLMTADPPKYNDTLMTAYLFLVLGCTLFVDKNGCKVSPCHVVEAMDFSDKIGDYSWGSATVAYLYRQLGIASRSDCRDIAGCLTLLQAWIYEYFPIFRPHQQRNIIQPGYPRSCMWNVRQTDMGDKGEHQLHLIRRRLDKLTASGVEWLPYGPDPYKEVPRTLLMPGFLRYRDIIEPYLPDRVIRQLGYVQDIPLDIPKPLQAFRPETSAEYKVKYDTAQAEWIWRAFPRVGRLDLSELKPFSHGFTDVLEYMCWFTGKSRPRILNERVEGSVTPARLAHWKKTMMSIMEPIYKARDQMPNKETKNACARWEIFRQMCNNNQNPT